jgi:hypothetical protein
MAFVRVLAHLLLALALLAGGALPGMAEAGNDAPSAAQAAPCHGMDDGDLADAPSPGPVGDCCGEAACTCDCLHHSPLGFQAHLPMATPPPRGRVALPRAGRLPMAGAAPEIRPPIA